MPHHPLATLALTLVTLSAAPALAQTAWVSSEKDHALTLVLRPQLASGVEKVQLATMSALMLTGVALLVSRRRTPGRRPALYRQEW